MTIWAKIGGLALVAIGGPGFLMKLAHANASNACSLSQQEKVANARLTFDEFDQKGTTPSTWRQLSNRHCWLQSIEAAEDYLIHGKLENDGQRRDIVFHIAQSLALNGQNSEAALLVAGAKDGDQSKSAEFDWNTYLDGTWAYLTGNKTELKAMRDRLSAEGGEGNKFNASALNGLLNCFNEPYSVAYEKACRVQGQ